MSKKILIDAVYPGETRVVIYDQGRIQDFDYENSHKKQLKGNIYLAKVTRVEPSLQAAFIEYGGNKHGFLPFNEIHPNYFIHNKEISSLEQEKGDVLADKISAITISDVIEVDEPADESEKLDLQEELNETLNPQDDIEDEIETDEEEHKTHSVHQNYKIQDVIKKGQAILIQVMKEERGNKGAACTSYISLAGRYCVLMPNSDKQGGISRRISNLKDRKRLKEVLTALNFSEGSSVILRTAGAGKTVSDIRKDYHYLARLWNSIRECVLSANVETFIHAESDLLKRTIRDLYSSEISEILIQGTDAYKSIKEFIKKLLPLHVNKIKEYKNKTPIFTKFNVEEQLAALYNPVVHLQSGGYIVINPTEALIAIDVNSGKSTNERNIEETATKTNLEASVEIARQLRLRDMSGLVVIDFIDMMELSNRRLVEKTLHDAFQNDRAKVQLSTISPFGLLELSRQRLQSSFMETNMTACPACNGKGYIKAFETNSMVILRTIESEICKSDCEAIKVFAHPDVILSLLNNKRDQVSKLENDYKCKIIFEKENTVYYDGFAIEKVMKDNKFLSKNSSPKFNEADHMESYEAESYLEEITIKKEEQLGFGEDISPLKVNDNMIMSDSAETYNKYSNRKNRYRKGTTKRKGIKSTEDNLGNSIEEDFNTNQPTLIYQQEDNKVNPRKNHNNRRRNHAGNVRDRRHKKNDNHNKVKKKSALQTWWEKLIE